MHKPGKPADSPVFYRSISTTSCIFKLFERLVLNRLCYYLESKNLISPTQPASNLVGSQLFKFFCCPNLFETASKKKELQTELFWPPLIFLKLLIRSGTSLSSTNSPLCSLDQVFSVRQKSKGPLSWCSKSLVSNQTRCPSGLRPWLSLLHPTVYVDDLAKTLHQGTKHSLNF